MAKPRRRLPDVIAPDLKILFCGINPGLYSAAVGHHFARPGNRFWAALYLAGYTDQLYAPVDDRALLQLGYGLTNIVPRATAQADDLTRRELRAGRRRLEQKVRRYTPQWVAILGISAYRVAFARRSATFGLQTEPLGGSRVWVLPNPSGLNAHHQRADLARAFRRLLLAAAGAAHVRSREEIVT